MPDGIEDNYVDEMFLKGLVHKNSFPDLHYPSMIKETLEIIHVVNTLVQFLVCFKYLSKDGNQEVEIFFKILTLSVVLFALFTVIHWEKYKVADVLTGFKTAIFLVSTLLFLTPVLKSLTVSYSDDTVILLVVIFIILHLLLYDYNMVKRPVDLDNITRSVGSPVSLNAIFFATILLSSRLEKVRQVFVLLFLSMVLFGFGPLFRQSLRGKARSVSDLLAVVMTLLNVVFILEFSQLYALLYLSSVLFVTMICPLIFIYAYQFKNDMIGPWDLPNVMQYHSID